MIEDWITDVTPHTLIDRTRLRVLAETLASVAHLPGAMAEIGVYRGGSAVLLHRVAQTRRLYLFDTFAGHPDPTEADDVQAHPAGRFADTSPARVLAMLVGAPVTVHVGRFPASVEVSLPPLAFVHLDVDLYESVRDGLATCWPALLPGGVLVVDDYGFHDCPGAKQAVDEFGGAEVLTTGQAVLRKPAA